VVSRHDRGAAEGNRITLLTDIQAVADRYAAARTAYDAAHATGDKGAMALHWERLTEAEEAWWPLAHEFTKRHEDDRSLIEHGMVVVWKRGAVGMQGTVIDAYAFGGPDTILKVQTPRGAFAEYARNLMPLEMVKSS
jgi:hypothetical protein